MQKPFLTMLCATAIGFSHATTALSQSTPVAPAVNKSNASHFPRAGFEAIARMKKSGLRKGVPFDGMKKDDSWYRQTPDPCQVEG
jgi:hypothetical protein